MAIYSSVKDAQDQNSVTNQTSNGLANHGFHSLIEVVGNRETHTPIGQEMTEVETLMIALLLC